MAITIAGRLVKQGDSLYHVGKRCWGTVVRFDTNSAVLRITSSGDESNYTDIFVTDNGEVRNVKQVYWHKPLDLDLPYADISREERILKFLIAELGHGQGESK